MRCPRELDIDTSEAVDGDTKEEEEALAGRQVNPKDVDYSCISWQPDAPGTASAQTMGWESDRPVRSLSRADFTCTASEIIGKLQQWLSELTAGFLAQVQGLDPTQKLTVDVVAEWAGERKKWTTTYIAPGSARRSPTLQPKSRSYDSVLTNAFSGVASANLGTGSRTINSIIHTNCADAGEDLQTSWSTCSSM